MDILPVQFSPLHLELLESRTLLAGGWEADFATVTPAISGAGDYQVAFNPRIGNSELIITGSADSSLIINFDLLPAFVTSVRISQFDAVSFTGTDVLNKLVATDIETLNASGISINYGVYSDNVDHLTLASGGSLALLTGSNTKLEIAKLDGTLLISDLESLSLVSESRTLSIVSLNSTQVIKVLYAADQVSVAGLADTQQQVLLLPNGEATPPVVPDPGVVVTITPSDSANELLARLRELVRSGIGDNELLAFSLVGLSSWQVSHSEVTLVPTTGMAAPSLLQAGFQLSLAQAEAIPVDLEPARHQTLGDIELSGLLDLAETVESADIAMLPGEWWAEAQIAPEAGNAAELALLTSSDSDSPDTPRGYVDLQDWLREALVTEPANLKNRVMERIAAELTPGEQTAYLLVDPKPARAGLTKNRESALDSFD